MAKSLLKGCKTLVRLLEAWPMQSNRRGGPARSPSSPCRFHDTRRLAQRAPYSTVAWRHCCGCRAAASMLNVWLWLWLWLW
eukprot:CAMPEP_0174706512 /NCGR_PEP_ID=MMETSP1094-20130205/9329_1 /TAXON_ID=156173 /ORGANISM="Chrysochromulina brevifilum, Strain UTEX LB 985" /LENGTH=80 /DNA_ID=CAMNT_0015904779 /DNA_START=619 /DNA_END=858 /DNA_ORIENTATION=+